jgi:ferredoxin
VPTISKVTILDGCISCGVCEAECPDVFEMQDVAVIKKGVDVVVFADQIRAAAEACPVQVIKVE